MVDPESKYKMVSVSVFRTERWVALLRSFLVGRREKKKKETKNRLYSKSPSLL